MPLEITPIGAGFEANQTRPDLTDAQKATVIEEFAQKMTELQCAFQYKNSHMSELEESFIIKPLFILNRVLSSQPQHQHQKACAALMLLVADQDVFFKDADDKYSSQKSNATFYSNLRKAKGELAGFDSEENSVQSQLIDRSLKVWFHLDGGNLQEFEHRADVELAAKILYAVIREANSPDSETLKTSSRPRVLEWLYSSEHIAPSQYNRSFYQSMYQIAEDGYLDRSRRLPENNSEQLKFAKKLKKEQNFHVGMIDVEVCARDFERLVAECEENPICSADFYEKVVYSLHQFGVQERIIKKRAPKIEHKDEERIIRNFAGFQERYQRICALEDGFRNPTPPVEKLMNISISWETSINRSQRTPIILTAINSYRHTMNIGRQDDGLLEHRIDWILDVARNRKLPRPS